MRHGAGDLGQKNLEGWSMSQTIDAAVDNRTTAQDQLCALAKTIQAEHSAVVRAACGVVEHAIEAGEALIAAKDKLASHGKWEGWLGKRTAQIYMQLARARLEIEAKAHRSADLSLRAALQLIRPKTKKEPRQKKPTSKATLNHLAWSDATPQEPTKLLDAIGYSSLILAIPLTWGQKTKEAFAGSVSDRATTALKMALSTTIEGEALAALATIKRILAAGGGDLHDIQIAISKRGQRRAA
jgi:hypothetical protein